MLQTPLARAASGTFGLKIANTGLLFLASVFLARLLGASGFGAYAYAIAWVNLLTVFAVMGLDRLVVREIAIYVKQSSWGLLGGILRWSSIMTVFISLGIALISAGIAWIFTKGGSSQMTIVFWIAIVMLPFVTLTRLWQSTLQGLKHIVVGQLPEMLIRPVLFIIFIGMAYIIYGGNIDVVHATGFQVIAAGIAFIFCTLQLRKLLPSSVYNVDKVYRRKQWIRSALPLLFISGMNIVNVRIDTIMLGIMKGAEEAGIYVVASRGSEMIGFVIVAVNVALMPTIASLYASGEMGKLQKIITRSARIMLIIAVPVFLSLILFGYWFLYLFGIEFTKGQPALIILCIGQMLNVAVGCVGTLLTMTGHERDAATGVGISVISNLILNVVLIPKWGAQGAATATVCSLTISNIIWTIFVYKRLGISATAIGKIGLRMG